MKKYTLYAFVLISIAELISVTYSIGELSLVAKPLIMIALAAYYFSRTSIRSSLFLTALFFCWLGDVLLMFDYRSELFFMAGLGSFLTGHILYILCYQRFRFSIATNPLLGPQKIRFSLPIILAGTGLVVVLYPKLGDLTMPVVVYALVITFMALQALFRFGYTSTKSFALVFCGALCFMISDSLLAINKFLQAIPFASVWIMSTYMLAQYLIVEGVIAHENKKAAHNF
ncbi:MAG: lysoplasmalogenase [Cyclobacteriaceae bacterium]|nr:lysoplasmalogenase [Cyclobacteriaceae bacterium]